MSWPKRAAGFWEEAPVFRLLLPFIAGILGYDAFPQARMLPLMAVAAALLLTLFFLNRFRRFTNGYLALRFLALWLFMAVTGYGLAAANDVRNRPNWIGKLPAGKGALLLRISTLPKATAKTWRMEAEVLSVFDSTNSKPSCGKVQLTLFKHDSLCRFALGDTIIISNQLKPLSGPNAPFGFDARAFYARQNIYHGALLPENGVMLYARQATTEVSLIARLHRKAMSALSQNVADADTRALLQAMLLGNEADFDPDIRQTYADTGVIHVVAISGSHLATLFAMFFFIPYLLRGVRGRRVQYSLGLITIWTYVLVAGAPPSAIRAAVVFTLLAGSILLNVRHNTLNTLLTGVLLVLCFQPMWVYSVGFQLSVGAVLSIVVFYPQVRRVVVVQNPVLRVVWNALALSFCAQLLVAPLSVYYFHNFPALFLFANLAAWILIGVIALFGGIGVIVFSPLPPVAQGIASITAFFVHLFNRFIKIVQGLNAESLRHIQLSPGELVLWYLLIASVAVWLIHRNKKAFFLSGFAMAALLGISIHNQHKTLAQERLLVYGKSNAGPVADYIWGRHFQPLMTDVPEDSFKTAKAARTGFRAWRKSSDTAAFSIHRIAGKTVLLYADSANHFAAPLNFPVDVLLISRPLKGLSLSQLQTAFHPGIIVAAGVEKQWRTLAWKDSCKALKQPFHATALEGAYVLE